MTLLVAARHSGTWKWGRPWVKKNGVWNVARSFTTWSPVWKSPWGYIPTPFTEYGNPFEPQFAEGVVDSYHVYVAVGSNIYFNQPPELPAGNIDVYAGVYAGYGPWRFQFSINVVSGSASIIGGADSGWITNKNAYCRVNASSGAMFETTCTPTNYFSHTYGAVVSPPISVV
jgi:hypothetical protein